MQQNEQMRTADVSGYSAITFVQKYIYGLYDSFMIIRFDIRVYGSSRAFLYMPDRRGEVAFDEYHAE